MDNQQYEININKLNQEISKQKQINDLDGQFVSPDKVQLLHKLEDERNQLIIKSDKEAEDQLKNTMDDVMEKKCDSLTSLNRYMETRKTKTWARNYDDYADLADKLNNKFKKYVKHMKQYDLTYFNMNEEWSEINTKAEELQKEVENDDALRIEQLNKVKCAFAELKTELNALNEDSSWTDSPLYRNVLTAALNYQRAKTYKERQEMIIPLKEQVLAYAKIRHSGWFGSSIKAPKGKRRMKRMDKILTFISVIEEIENYHKIRERLRGDLDQRKTDKTYADFIKEDTHNRVGLANEARVRQTLITEERNIDGELTDVGQAMVEKNKILLQMMNNVKDFETAKTFLLQLYVDLDTKAEYSIKDATPSQLIKLSKDVMFLRKGTAFNCFDDTFMKLRKSYEKEFANDKELQYIYNRLAPVSSLYTAMSNFWSDQGIESNGKYHIQIDDEDLFDGKLNNNGLTYDYYRSLYENDVKKNKHIYNSEMVSTIKYYLRNHIK